MTTEENPLPTNLQELRARSASGEQFAFLFFWGHQLPTDGMITKSCLSQWYPAPFTVEGVRYPTAEHWMMAQKARLFSDAQSAEEILVAADPKTAKQLGRRVRGFDDNVWAAHCHVIVRRGNVHKFRQNRTLREFLLSTAGKILVEASPHDQAWGIGLRSDDPRALDPLQWRGTNLLGFALMVVRDELTQPAD